MPSSFSSLLVKWYDESDNYATSADITADVTSLPQFTDTLSGELNEATIVIRAKDGRYITSSSPTKIDKFDRIEISITDRTGFSYQRFFEVDERIPSESKSEGDLLTLKCLGIEYHVGKINMAFPFWFSDAREVGERIGLIYERNRGNRQPSLNAYDADYSVVTKIGNGLPKWTNNHYEYGLAEDTCYNRFMDVIDKLGASVDNGGVLDFFELAFKTPSVSQIDLRIFSSGAPPQDNGGTPVTIETPSPTTNINPADTEAGMDNPTGTLLVAYGDPTHGSLPGGHSKYESGIYQFVFRPEWQNFITYPQNARIMYQGKHYKSAIDNNTSTPPTNWTQIDWGDEFGDTIQYSSWTDGKVADWIDCAAGASLKTGPVSGVYTSTGAAMFDCNLIIDSDDYFRTWVHARAKSTADLNALLTAGSDWSYQGTAASLPRGFRVLVDGTGTGVFGGNDRNGKARNNSVQEIQVNRNTGLKGFVGIYFADSTVDKFQVAVLNEVKVWEWQNGSSTWSDVTTADYANDCFHPWTTMQNAASFDTAPTQTDSTKFPDITKAGGTFSTNIDSAIKVVFDYNSAILDRITDRDDYLQVGAWLVWQVPFPPNDISQSDKCGGLYGGRANTTDNPHEPATLDTTNMGYTPAGGLSFNYADSEELGQLHAIAFMLKLKLEARLSIAATLEPVTGPQTIRCFMIDTADNVVTQDFEILSADDRWYRFVLPFSSFRIYRSHRTRYSDRNNLNLTNPRRNDMNQAVFEYRNIKFIGLQLMRSYDEFDRFNPEGTLGDLITTKIHNNLGGKATLTMDDFHFKKVLLVTTGVETVRDLQPEFLKRPHIMLYDQLKQDARAIREIEQFEHKEFDIESTGPSVFDIQAGDSFYVKNPNLVSDADNGANTIKLVAKRIEYSITKPVAGAGGLRRRIRGVKRFS